MGRPAKVPLPPPQTCCSQYRHCHQYPPSDLNPTSSSGHHTTISEQTSKCHKAPCVTNGSRPSPMSFSAPSPHSATRFSGFGGDWPWTRNPHCCPQPHWELMLSLLLSGDKWPWDCVTWAWPPSGSLDGATLEVKSYWFCWSFLPTITLG